MSVGRQGLLFLMIGAMLFALDWLSFVALTAVGMTVVGANVAARVLAALIGFWLNGRLTFAGPGGPRLGGTHLLRFILLWLVFLGLSTLCVAWTADMPNRARQ
jgi:putative flippase GtrA